MRRYPSFDHFAARRLLVGAFAGLFALALHAQSAVLDVADPTGGDDTSLIQTAINTAWSSNIPTVRLKSGKTYNLVPSGAVAPLTFSHSLTFDGNGATITDNRTTLTTTGESIRISTSWVTIKDLTFIHNATQDDDLSNPLSNLNTIAVVNGDHVILRNIAVSHAPKTAFAVVVTGNDTNAVRDLLLENCSSDSSGQEAFRFKQYTTGSYSGVCMSAHMLRCTSTNVQRGMSQGAGSDRYVIDPNGVYDSDNIKGHVWYRALTNNDAGDPLGRSNANYCGLQIDQCTFDSSAQIVATINAKNLFITGSTISGGILINLTGANSSDRNHVLIMDNYIDCASKALAGKPAIETDYINHGVIYRNHFSSTDTTSWMSLGSHNNDVVSSSNYSSGY